MRDVNAFARGFRQAPEMVTAPARLSFHPSTAFELLFSMLLLLIVGGFSTYLVLA